MDILKKHISLTVTPNLVVLEPRILLQRVDYYYAVWDYVWCDVKFFCAMFICIVASRRASHRGARNSAG
jgi:hypothetical protein